MPREEIAVDLGPPVHHSAPLMVQAMLLAAGLGTRLWPLTADRGKPAVPFLGRPLIAHAVALLARHGIRRAVVNTHYLPESIHLALAETNSFDVDLRFSHEPEILGTAGGLAQALARGLLDPDAPTLIINAKLFTDADLSGLLETHARAGTSVTMLLRHNQDREAFREVLVEGERVVGFGEGRKPQGSSPLLFTGIHVLAAEILRSLPLRFSDTISDIYPPLIDQRRVAAVIDQSPRWWEFSTLERYLALHRRAAREGLGPEVVAASSATISLDAEVRRAVIWPRARVEAGAHVEDAIIGEGVTIRAGETLRGAAVIRRELAGRGELGETWGDRIRVPIAAH